MGTPDAMKGVAAMRAKQLEEAKRLLAYSNQLTERLIADAGDAVSMALVQHQNDIAQWFALEGEELSNG